MRIVMLPEAIITGSGIVISAFWINHKIVKLANDGMSVWYGWVGGLLMRFAGIAIAGIYLAVKRPYGDSFESSVNFMLTVLAIVTVGMLGDLILSLTRIEKKRKAGF